MWRYFLYIGGILTVILLFVEGLKGQLLLLILSLLSFVVGIVGAIIDSHKRSKEETEAFIKTDSNQMEEYFLPVYFWREFWHLFIIHHISTKMTFDRERLILRGYLYKYIFSKEQIDRFEIHSLFLGLIKYIQVHHHAPDISNRIYFIPMKYGAGPVVQKLHDFEWGEYADAV